MTRASISIYCLTAFLLLTLFAVSSSAANSLKQFLPGTSDFHKIKSVGETQEATGKELYGLINGGAELYVRYGFKKAIFQEYIMVDDRVITIEIYEMTTSTESEGIFRKKKGEGGLKMNFGQNGILLDYYCLLQQGPYFFTVTGDEATADVRQNITEMARIVMDRISKRGDG